MLNDNEIILEEYKRIVKNNNFRLISRIYCLYCVENSCQWLDIELITSDETKIKMANAVYDYFLDTNIQITKISDIICANWNDYLNKDDFKIKDYLEEEY